MPSPYELKTRWLEWHEGLAIDDDALLELLEKIPVEQAHRICVEFLRRYYERFKESTPPAPQAG